MFGNKDLLWKVGTELAAERITDEELDEMERLLMKSRSYNS